MKHTDAKWAITMVVAVSLGSALGCSDSKPDGTGGAGGSGGAGATGAAGGGTDAGGGAAGAGGADAGPTVAAACAHVARVTCQKYIECLPWYVPLNFGDIDTCIKRYTATLCENRVGLDDSGDTLAATEACAAARTAATCAQWFENDLAVSACLPQPGTRPMGSACGMPSHCQSTNCIVSAGVECGTCGGPLAGEGATCTSSGQCASNLQCFEGVCGLPRGLGEPCSPFATCQYAFICVNGRCAVAAKAGEPCSNTMPCRSRDGLSCNNGVCEPWQYAGPGEPCNELLSRLCRGSGFCKTNGVEFDGVCEAAAEEGQPCDNAQRRFCLPYASCVQGVCKVPNVGMCK